MYEKCKYKDDHAYINIFYACIFSVYIITYNITVLTYFQYLLARPQCKVNIIIVFVCGKVGNTEQIIISRDKITRDNCNPQYTQVKHKRQDNRYLKYTCGIYPACKQQCGQVKLKTRLTKQRCNCKPPIYHQRLDKQGLF